MRSLQIAVIGSAGSEEYQFAKPDSRMFKEAETIGRMLAEAGCIVVSGGKGGVMLAVSRGAKLAGGITAAEISGVERLVSNRYTDVEIVTGDIAFRGPSQIIAMSDAVITLGGGAGTLQEICVAYRLAKPMVLLTGFSGWTDRLSSLKWLDERKIIKFEVVTSSDQAVERAINMAKSRIRSV